MIERTRSTANYVALAILSACSSSAVPPPNAPTPAAPKLVVLVVIDQWPEWAFEQKRAALTNGFARLLTDGEWRVGRYPSIATLTGPSHALLGTGEPPASSGIVADEWWHRDVGKVLEAVHDVDGSVTRRWLQAPGLGDDLASHPSAVAVDVALKPRAAVLPIGHRGLSVWYDRDVTAWRSFSMPAWLESWNAAHPISERLHEVWTPTDPTRLAALSGVSDDQVGEVGSEGFGATFPHDPQATKSPSKALLAMPLGNDLVLELAEHAIDAEHLGQHQAPDLLVVGVSAHDYVGHGWGQESWELWDLELRLDARLDRFLSELDRRVGSGAWAMIVTSDHGASPLPERVGGGRIIRERLQTIANDAATAVLGEGQWIEAAEYPTISFSKGMLEHPARGTAEERVIAALRTVQGISRVGRVSDVAGRCETRSGDERALCLALHPERSGELFYLPASGWIVEDQNEPTATAHGSLNDYDRLVPVIVLAPGRHSHPPQTSPSPGQLNMTEVAPLLRSWLGVPR